MNLNDLYEVIASKLRKENQLLTVAPFAGSYKNQQAPFALVEFAQIDWENLPNERKAGTVEIVLHTGYNMPTAQAVLNPLPSRLMARLDSVRIDGEPLAHQSDRFVFEADLCVCKSTLKTLVVQELRQWIQAPVKLETENHVVNPLKP